MYPKVKVRVQDLEDDQDDDLSFSWSAISSSGEYHVDSPQCVIRVPTAQIRKQQIHQTQEPKDTFFSTMADQKDKKSEDIDKMSKRATSVTRPRAVLSSPENDEMIGSENSKRVIQPSPIRNLNMVQKREVEQKIIPLLSAMKTPVGTRQKPTSAVNNLTHTPSTTDSLNAIKRKPKAVIAENYHTHSINDGLRNTKGKPKSVTAVNNHTPSTTDSLHRIKRLPKAVNVENNHTHTTDDSCSNTKGKPKTVTEVNDHTLSTMHNLRSIQGRLKTVKDQTLTEVKQSAILSSSQQTHLKSGRAKRVV